MAGFSEAKPCRVLSLDGGGAKGFYTLGVLREIEGMTQRPLCECFDLIFGTSTGAIIAALLGLGRSVDEITKLYEQYVPTVMKEKSVKAKTQALAGLAAKVFKEDKFDKMRTRVGIVATRWVNEEPMIFKTSVDQAHGRPDTFTPGFGVTIADAVQASCSAFPFFEKKKVRTAQGDEVVLIDGGYCANNPTLYAVAEAVTALRSSPEHTRVVSVGVGFYPPVTHSWFTKTRWQQKLLSVQLLQKTLDINTQSMERLRNILFFGIPTVRISDKFEKPEMATDLFEHNMTKLNLLRQHGSASFAAHEAQLREFLL